MSPPPGDKPLNLRVARVVRVHHAFDIAVEFVTLALSARLELRAQIRALFPA